jgi:hypothetical protein
MGAQNQGGGQAIGNYQPPPQPSGGMVSAGNKGGGAAQPSSGATPGAPTLGPPTASPMPAYPPMGGMWRPGGGGAWGGGGMFKPPPSDETMAHMAGQNYTGQSMSSGMGPFASTGLTQRTQAGSGKGGGQGGAVQ